MNALVPLWLGIAGTQVSSVLDGNSEGDAMALGEEDSEFLGEGDAEALGDEHAEALGEGDAEALGEGDAEDLGEGGAEALGKDIEECREAYLDAPLLLDLGDNGSVEYRMLGKVIELATKASPPVCSATDSQ